MKKIILCAFLFSVCGFYPAISASTLPDSELDGGFVGGDSDQEVEITPNPGAGLVDSCTPYATGQSCTLDNCTNCIYYQYTTTAGFHNNYLSCAKCVSGYDMTSYPVDNECSNLRTYKCTKNQLVTCANCSCTDTITYPQTGYKMTVSRDCDPTNNCKCTNRSTTYSCASEYYQSGDIDCQTKPGTSTIQCSGCTKCPENYNTCSGTTFTCKSGYYKSDTECKACPDNYKTCSGTTFTCKDGYYKSGSTCQKCPDNSTCTSGTNFTCNKDYYKSDSKCESCGEIKINESKTITMVTDAAGATNKSACHLPDDDKNTTYETTYNGHNVTVKLTGSCSKN